VGCLRCGRRQVDPDSGPSAWRRAVAAGEQVLVCPDCQVEGWTDGLDRCPACGSTVLVKQLGDVVCRACGQVSAPPVDRTPGSRPEAASRALAEDVATAVDRVLGRD
jgi:DNA-directed RNA polymerase subunit RPC12/RpoP